MYKSNGFGKQYDIRQNQNEIETKAVHISTVTRNRKRMRQEQKILRIGSKQPKENELNYNIICTNAIKAKQSSD